MTAAIENHRARLRAGEIYNGLWMMSTSPELAKIGSAAGFDYVCLDLQHGLVRPTDVLRLTDAVRASGDALVTARVAANRFTEIGALADAGVEAIIVPLVSSVEEAQAAVAALDYPSRGGDRSWGPTAEIMHGAVQDTRDERPLLFVMIENEEGLSAVEDICAVPGIDGVYVGPSDLAFAVGACPGSTTRLTPRRSCGSARAPMPPGSFPASTAATAKGRGCARSRASASSPHVVTWVPQAAHSATT